MSRTILLAAALLLPRVALGAPVTLIEVDTQAFLQENGGMDVIYNLTFEDHEGRSSIRKAGPFYEPIHFTRAWIKDGERKHKASVSSVGGGYYRIDFGSFSTRAGGRYTVELHYRNNYRFADPRPPVASSSWRSGATRSAGCCRSASR